MRAAVVLLGAWLGMAGLAPAQDEKIKKLLAEADGFYAKRDQEGMAAKAVETCQKVLVLDETCVEAYWKISRTYYWLGPREKDDEKRGKLYREGVEYCKMAVALDENSVPAHFWLGVMYGLFGESKGILQSLDLVEPLKKEMEWVLKKDESFSSGGAHRVLGRLYHKLPGIKGGDNQKAIQYLLRAIEIGPDMPLSYLYLAEVYVDEGRRDEAKKMLGRLLELKDPPDWVPESREQKEQAREQLKVLEGK